MKSTPPFEPRHILCPADFSELSNLALRYAAAGAREYGAKLTVLHAETFELPRYFVRGETEQLVRELAAAKEGARASLAQHVKSILGGEGEGFTLQCEILEAHPVEAVLRTAENESVDLIVVGAHGYGGVKRLLLGSVTENVVRHATVPVFAVRQKEHQFIDTVRPDSVVLLNRILCPVNATEVAGTALRHAVSLAEHFHAEVTVLYCVESRKTEDLSRTTESLCSWISETVKAHCPLEPAVRHGQAAEQIIAQAREERDDLIVLGAQHRSFLEGTFFGRTTELVLRHAPVPVLVTPLFPSP
jgi:nucleotide-binding universal stress UspA family protein